MDSLRLVGHLASQGQLNAFLLFTCKRNTLKMVLANSCDIAKPAYLGFMILLILHTCVAASWEFGSIECNN